MSVTENGSASNLGVILPIVVVAIGAVALMAWLFNIKPPLDRSVLGMEGFANVAQKKGDLNIKFYTGVESIKDSKYGLRILPLYDSDITEIWKPTLMDGVELREMPDTSFEPKLREMPTLAILPKWKQIVVNKEKLHPEYLISLKAMKPPYWPINDKSKFKLKRQPETLTLINSVDTVPGWTGAKLSSLKLALYYPQTFINGSSAKPRCKPLITHEGNALLAKCRYFSGKSPKNPEFWLLTDPDIMNNHGAGNGDNYQFAVNLVAFLAKGKPIIVDGTNQVFSSTAFIEREPKRSFADLARFFQYPFSLTWIAFIGLVFFTLWHAWRRVGPILDSLTDDTIQASKASVIEANVSILRGVDRTGAKDADLARAYASQRMASLSVELFGNGRKSGIEGETQLFAALARRNSALSDDLKTVRVRLSANSAHESKTKLFENLKQFEQLTQEARHEFGRPSNPR